MIEFARYVTPEVELTLRSPDAALRLIAPLSVPAMSAPLTVPLIAVKLVMGDPAEANVIAPPLVRLKLGVVMPVDASKMTLFVANAAPLKVSG